VTTSVYELAPVTTHYRITANAGDPLDLLIPILDRDGDPVRITPGEVPLWSASAQVRRNVIACEVLHEWRTDGAAPNAEIVPGDPAKVRLLASASETAAWQDWPDYTVGWDLEVTGPPVPLGPGGPHRIASALMRVNPRYTR